MKNQSSIAIGKVAAALLADLERHNFTPSLTYRTRAHKLNCFKAEDVKAAFKLTLAAHPDVDTSELRLRVMAIGKVRSKDAMNWQIDDLINFLQSWVRAGQLTQERAEEEAAKPEPKAEEWVYFREGGSCVIRRFSRDWPTTSFCELSTDGGWIRSFLSTKDAIEMLGRSNVFECDEQGEPLTKPDPQLPVNQYFPHQGVKPTGPEYLAEIERMKAAKAEQPAQPTIKPLTEATDPETELAYKVDASGQIWVRQKGKEVFHAAPVSSR